MGIMYDLKSLRHSTKIKLVFMSLSIVLPLILISILTPISNKFFSDYVTFISIKILRYVVVAALEAFIIVKIVFYGRILKSDSYAEKVLITRNDERVTFIRQKTSSFSIKLFLFSLIMAVVVSGFLSTRVFITLLIVAASLGVIYLSTYIYYRKKY